MCRSSCIRHWYRAKVLLKSIVKGIHALEAEKVDVMIVGRGGGSMEESLGI